MRKNKIITIQEMLMREMQRLDDSVYMSNNSKVEVLRSNALTNNATAYIKAVNVQLKVKELSQKNKTTVNKLEKELGIE